MANSELMDLLVSGNLKLNGNDISHIGDIMREALKERERRVTAVLGEPVETTKKGREGVYFRYCKNISKGLQKDIVRKDRSAVIMEAFQILFGDNADLKEMTVAEVFEEWYKDRQAKKSSKTCLIDHSFWNTYLKKSKLAGMKLASVRAEHIEETLTEICGDHKIERSSLNPVLTLIRGIWSKAVSIGIVEVNLPKNMEFREIKLNTKQPKSEVQKLEEVYRNDEIKKLRDRLWSIDRTVYDQAILFLSFLGIRIGEMRAITWDDYSPVTGMLDLSHEIVKRQIGEKNYVDVDVSHTKGYAAMGQRKFKLPTPCIQILEELRAVNGDRKYVFQSAGVNPINPNHLNARLKAHCKEAGIRYFSSHKFRFYWISRAYELGIDERIIQMIAGHASLDMTRKYNRSTHVRELLTQEQMNMICGF